VKRASEQELKAAAIACGLESPPGDKPAAGPADAEAVLQKKLEESRYFPEE
jgi:hypothetical protein